MKSNYLCQHPLLQASMMSVALAVSLCFAVGCDSKSNSPEEATAQGAAAKMKQPAPAKNAPAITNLSFDPSTFASCGESIEICVEALDPDGDAMAARWSGPEGKSMTFERLESTQNGNTFRECTSVTPPGGQSRLSVEIVESDKAADAAQSDTLEFPVRVAGDC
jgi:hypothetical protein